MKKLNVKGFLALVGVGVFFVLAALTAKGLTESGTRSALASWMKGDAVVQNPFAAVVDFVTENGITVVDTFADLLSVNGNKRIDGSVVLVRGNQSATGTGGGLYYYSSTSTNTTNTYGTSAVTSPGGRMIAMGPQFFVVSQGWDPPSVTNGSPANMTFTNYGTLPQPLPGDLVLVSHAGVATANSNVVLVAQVNSSSNLIVNLSSAGGTIDVATGLVRVAYWKQ